MGVIDPLPTFANGGYKEVKERHKTYRRGSCRLPE